MGPTNSVPRSSKTCGALRNNSALHEGEQTGRIRPSPVLKGKIHFLHLLQSRQIWTERLERNKNPSKSVIRVTYLVSFTQGQILHALCSLVKWYICMHLFLMGLLLKDLEKMSNSRQSHFKHFLASGLGNDWEQETSAFDRRLLEGSLALKEIIFYSKKYWIQVVLL